MENNATILGDENLDGEGNIIEISYSELAQATSNFNELNKIGEGGFGAVYRGKLRGVERAIKILHKQEDASQVKAYEHEVGVLSRVKHPHIVRLIGTCRKDFIVVYELMSGGNLHMRLPHLYWKDRLRIATEICFVLSFIHNLRPEILVHGDLKPENVLLDANRISKLCDFGISRLIRVDPQKSLIYHKTDVKGTQGYLDPYFVQTRRLAPSSDVYSFGMLLFRLLTKERIGYGLTVVVEDAIANQALGKLLDDEAGWPNQLAEELSKVALKCCNLRPKQRPNLTEVYEELKKMMYKYHKELRITIFSYTELVQATTNFSKSNMLGEDNFGKVYRGNLKDNEVVIKLTLRLDDPQQEKAFIKEVNILGTLVHPNLVRLIGTCPEKFALVYEFMPGGTLEDRLDQKDLLWKDCLRIATEVCTTIAYLHSLEPDFVVHGDVKPSNVLFNTDGVSKLTGFGTGRLIPRSTTTVTINHITGVQGTHGYLDPAFIQTGWLSPSVDVYSFGMLLLRILTKESVGYGLIAIVEDALEEEHLGSLLDDVINWPCQLAKQLCQLALKCCNLRPSKRPNAAQVLENLEEMKKKFLTD